MKWNFLVLVPVWPLSLESLTTSGMNGLAPWTQWKRCNLVLGYPLCLKALALRLGPVLRLILPLKVPVVSPNGNWVLSTIFRAPPEHPLQSPRVLLQAWVSIIPGWLCTCTAVVRWPRVLPEKPPSRLRTQPQRPGRTESQKCMELLIRSTTRMFVLWTLRLRPTPLLTSPTTERTRPAPFS